MSRRSPDAPSQQASLGEAGDFLNAYFHPFASMGELATFNEFGANAAIYGKPGPRTVAAAGAAGRAALVTGSIGAYPMAARPLS